MHSDKRILIGGWTDDSQLAPTASIGVGKAFISLLNSNGYHVWNKAMETLNHIRAVIFGHSANDNLVALFEESPTQSKLIILFLKRVDGAFDKMFAMNAGTSVVNIVPHLA